jgi:transcriptional antiterminator RfaH
MKSSELQWFAIQTKTAGEHLANSSLAQLELATLLPLMRRNPAGWRARRNPVKALFPGYLFARFCADTHLRAVRYARGVQRVVSARERPLPVEDSIIESLRARMDNRGCVALEVRTFTRGQSVRISAGPFAGWQGVFDSALGDAQRVVILLEALQQGRLIVQVDWVERCTAA